MSATSKDFSECLENFSKKSLNNILIVTFIFVMYMDMDLDVTLKPAKAHFSVLGFLVVLKIFVLNKLKVGEISTFNIVIDSV